MHISYTGRVLLQCPECHHQSTYIFDDAIMCILCGWERKRSGEAALSLSCQVRIAAEVGEDSGSSTVAGPDVLGQSVSGVQRASKRARKRARKAALEAARAQAEAGIVDEVDLLDI